MKILVVVGSVEIEEKERILKDSYHLKRSSILISIHTFTKLQKVLFNRNPYLQRSWSPGT